MKKSTLRKPNNGANDEHHEHKRRERNNERKCNVWHFILNFIFKFYHTIPFLFIILFNTTPIIFKISM